MSISNISEKIAINIEIQTQQSKNISSAAFEKIIQGQRAKFSSADATAPSTEFISSENLPLDVQTLNKPNNKQEPEQMSDDRHINAFIHQVLAYAPDSEKKIWEKMKEELGI